MTALAVDATNASVNLSAVRTVACEEERTRAVVTQVGVPLTDAGVRAPGRTIAMNSLEAEHHYTLEQARTITTSETATGERGFNTMAGRDRADLPGPFVGPFGAAAGGGWMGSLAVHPTNGQILLSQGNYFRE